MQFLNTLAAALDCVGNAITSPKQTATTVKFFIILSLIPTNDYSSLDALPSATALVIYFALIPLGKEW